MKKHFKSFFALSLALMLAATLLGCSGASKADKRVKPKMQEALTKGVLEKIEPVKGGFMLSARVKNGAYSTIARGFVPTLRGKSSDGADIMYEVGDLLLMRLKNNVIMYSELNIKNFTKIDEGVVGSKFKRNKSKIKTPVPQETMISF